MTGTPAQSSRPSVPLLLLAPAALAWGAAAIGYAALNLPRPGAGHLIADVPITLLLGALSVAGVRALRRSWRGQWPGTAARLPVYAMCAVVVIGAIGLVSSLRFAPTMLVPLAAAALGLAGLRLLRAPAARAWFGVQAAPPVPGQGVPAPAAGSVPPVAGLGSAEVPGTAQEADTVSQRVRWRLMIACGVLALPTAWLAMGSIDAYAYQLGEPVVATVHADDCQRFSSRRARSWSTTCGATWTTASGATVDGTLHLAHAVPVAGRIPAHASGGDAYPEPVRDPLFYGSLAAPWALGLFVLGGLGLFASLALPIVREMRATGELTG